MKTLRLFLTVGSQMPFDRLVSAVALWAQRHGPGVEVIAQVGETALDPRNLPPLKWASIVAPKAYRQHCDQCDLMIAHAGMGSVLTALECDKPLLVMPRRGPLRETRNDHQVDTVGHLLRLQPWCGGWPIQVAHDEAEIPARLDACIRRLALARAQASTAASSPHPPPADWSGAAPSERDQLIDHLRATLDRLRPGLPPA